MWPVRTRSYLLATALLGGLSGLGVTLGPARLPLLGAVVGVVVALALISLLHRQDRITRERLLEFDESAMTSRQRWWLDFEMHRLMMLSWDASTYADQMIYPDAQISTRPLLRSVIQATYAMTGTSVNPEAVKLLLACLKVIGPDADAFEALALVWTVNANPYGTPNTRSTMGAIEALRTIERLTSTLAKWRQEGTLDAIVALAGPAAASAHGQMNCQPSVDPTEALERLHHTVTLLVSA